jgi:hypothetical protein
MMPAGAMGPLRRAGDTAVRSVKDLHCERTVVHLAPELEHCRQEWWRFRRSTRVGWRAGAVRARGTISRVPNDRRGHDRADGGAAVARPAGSLDAARQRAAGGVLPRDALVVVAVGAVCRGPCRRVHHLSVGHARLRGVIQRPRARGVTRCAGRAVDRPARPLGPPRAARGRARLRRRGGAARPPAARRPVRVAGPG